MPVNLTQSGYSPVIEGLLAFACIAKGAAHVGRKTGAKEKTKSLAILVAKA